MTSVSSSPNPMFARRPCSGGRRALRYVLVGRRAYGRLKFREFDILNGPDRSNRSQNGLKSGAISKQF